MNSSNALMGVEPASADLLGSVAQKRAVQIVEAGSDELRYLDSIGAEANVGGEAMDSILLRPNPSKAAVLEEFLHGTQHKVGIIARRGVAGARCAALGADLVVADAAASDCGVRGNVPG